MSPAFKRPTLTQTIGSALEDTSPLEWTEREDIKEES